MCPRASAQATVTAPVLPNWDDGQEGEKGGESKTGANKLFHGELIDLVVHRGGHHPGQSQGQLQDDEHLSCGRDRVYQEDTLLSLPCYPLAESPGSSQEALCPSQNSLSVSAHSARTPASIQLDLSATHS